MCQSTTTDSLAVFAESEAASTGRQYSGQRATCSLERWWNIAAQTQHVNLTRR
jgi:hypothetical protein